MILINIEPKHMVSSIEEKNDFYRLRAKPTIWKQTQISCINWYQFFILRLTSKFVEDYFNPLVILRPILSGSSCLQTSSAFFFALGIILIRVLIRVSCFINLFATQSKPRREYLSNYKMQVQYLMISTLFDAHKYII